MPDRYYTPRAVAAEFDVRESRLVRWVDQDVIHASLHRTPGWRSIGRVTLFDLEEATLAATVAHLRDVHHVSMQGIRRQFHALRSMDIEVLDPRIGFHIAPRGPHGRSELFLQLGDHVFGDRAPRQLVWGSSLPLEPIRLRLEQLPSRRPGSIGQIVIPKGRHEPYIDGTRIRAAAVASWLSEGHDADRILQAYPTLERADVDAVRMSLTAS